ncbi:CBS and ACT domain-containing protein [uncultured Pseudodesulfovibrio sp.]|uniref:CBS and ACT domain-containing protein n=1 Tax=uncultured Pseudodesulfovibrio sp. TaxID=2035858 RepID=UPI0029C7A0AC|nr:CBS and ACT domain-containing protein [uncultured Pseudodesulfovibrio sp.]
MLVRDWMTANVISLGVNSSVMDAAEILHEKNIRQFPVIDRDAALVGIVSDRDIRDAMPSKFIPGDNAEGRGGGLYTLTASDIMTLDPITVTSDTAVNEVAEMLVRHKVGGLPVVDCGELVGIITQADVLRFLCAASGTLRSETQIAVRLEARPGPLASLLNEIREAGLAFSSVFTANDATHPGSRNAYIRLESLNGRSVEEIVETLQEKYTVLYYVNEGITVDVC